MTVARPTAHHPSLPPDDHHEAEAEAEAAAEARRVASRLPAVVDTGWPFVLAGLAMIGCSLLIPAADDLAHARHLRDRALVIEHHRIERLMRHEEFLEGLQARDETLALSLAASQLNQIPSDRTPVETGASSPGLTDASVFPALEPPPPTLPERHRGQSMLERLVLSPRTGLWFSVAGAVCVLVGLLPRTRRAG